MRKKSVDGPQPVGRTFLEQEIEDFFKTLNLETVAERQKFLQFSRPDGESQTPSNPDETLRVCFRDSTATDRVTE